MGDITQEREKGRSASAQDGAGLCTTPMPQPLTQPSHALPTKPIAQPYSHAARKEACLGREACCGRHNPREKGRSASAQDGAGLCTTPMPQRLTQPSHASPTKPIAQPYSRAATKEPCHGREACCGRHNPRERERKVSKCTRWDKSVHHTHATTPHATLACIADKTYCTTVLTGCDKGRMTREGSELWET